MNKSMTFASAMGRINDSYVTSAMSYRETPHKALRVILSVAASVLLIAVFSPFLILTALKYMPAPAGNPSSTAADAGTTAKSAETGDPSGLSADISMPPDTDLDLWILQDVSDLDLSGYPVLWDSGIAGEYYGKGYDLELDEYGHYVTEKQNVTYYLSPWPDISDEGKYVTRIVITDPEVRIYGLTLGSRTSDFEKVISENGYTFDEFMYDSEQECYIIAHKGDVKLCVLRKFGTDMISMSAECTNNCDLDLYYKYSPAVNAPIPPDTDLDLWILTDVRRQDWSGFEEIYGLFGGREFFGKGYGHTTDENGYFAMPERYVKYTVTSWPDAMSGNSYVTSILITDPSVRVFGLTCESSTEQFDEILTQHGFSRGETAIYSAYVPETTVWRGENYHISISIRNGVRRLAIAAPTTNNFDIIY